MQSKNKYYQPAHHCLKNYFGYKSFRPGQLSIILTILQKRDTLAILPTGGGKSLCFQIPGLVKNLENQGVTFVISPLISLMKDQVDTLQKKKIKATYLNSTLTQKELKNRLDKIKNNYYQFIYLAPERLQNRSLLEACSTIKINLVAIDEAHCISMWGHDFRPSYLKINNFLKKLKNRPTVAAFTATATAQVRIDIQKQLKLQQPKIYLNSFKRENLNFHVTLCRNSFQQELSLFKLLKKYHHQAGIIYTATRKKTNYLSKLIKYYWGQDWPVAAYHGGLENEKRALIQDKFLNDELQIISATNAFGMGVDKPNVAWVIHYHTPGNLENYYQEAGRAGRDGQPADCHLLFNPYDLLLQKAFIDQSHPETKHPQRLHQLKQLKSMIEYATTQSCRQQYILKYFAEKADKCQQCDLCLNTQLSLNDQEKKYQEKLIALRQQLAHEYQIKPLNILTNRVLQLLTIHQPQTKEEYARIPGLGYGWLKKWYNPFSCQ